jgi:ATP-dependent Clp protease ATP-binding subunit ClpB
VDLNRLTQRSQEALHDAQTKALRFGHIEIGDPHRPALLAGDARDGAVIRADVIDGVVGSTA